jgi:SAM-dependent methyltransferase
MNNTQLLDYPFDLYQRTRDIKEVVDIITRVSGNDLLKILDVGGFRMDADDRNNLLLREFIPNHHIYTLDIQDSVSPGYIQGDGINLPFKDKSFDVVVASDVFEHIPRPDRQKFLESLIRVTNNFIIIGGPFYSEKVLLAEDILFEYIKKILFVEQKQLKEHVSNQLPHIEEVHELLKKKGLTFTTFESGNLSNWLMMMMVKHYLMTIPDSDLLHAKIDRFYNMYCYESDHVGPGYRRVILSTREKASVKVLEAVNSHFSNYEKDHGSNKAENHYLGQIQSLLALEELRTRRSFEQKEAIIKQQAAQIEMFKYMRTTRVYRFIQFFNKLFFRPPFYFFRFLITKARQIFRVVTGKREHPLLSISQRLYRRWIKKNFPTKEQMEQLRVRSIECKYRPKISIIAPVYNTRHDWLEKAIGSVIEQVYENWELCLVNDGSTDHQVAQVLDKYRGKDRRINIKNHKRNRGIAYASNDALNMATGEFVAFMDSDDELHPLSLFEVVKLLNKHPEADVIYTDEDKLTVDGRRKKPVFKPDWSAKLMLTYNYINHLTVCRKQLVDRVGKFRPQYDWSQDYDLFLRVTEKTDKIFHLPKILYHWRSVPGSSASKVDIRNEALQKSKQILTETLQRRGIDGLVVEGMQPGTFRVKIKKK